MFYLWTNSRDGFRMRKQIKDLNQLKAELSSLIESVRAKKIFYNEAKECLKKAENELKMAKKYFYRSYKDWSKVRKDFDKAKKKLSKAPYELRKWSKTHFGDVIKFIEGDGK
jgi:septation ring formation regulator EzrA